MPEASPYRLVYVTASNQEEAKHIARTLLGDRLAACANVLGRIGSYYWFPALNAAIAEGYRSSRRASTGARGAAAGADARRTRAEGPRGVVWTHRCWAPHGV